MTHSVPTSAQRGAANAAPPAAEVHVLIATDKYKGSLTAHEVCRALASGLEAEQDATRVHAEPFPVADGGDGTVQAVLDAGYAPSVAHAPDALGVDRDITIALHHGTAVIETAQICGMAELATLAPLHSSTRGMGSAILAASKAGAHRVIVGLGGSAATDGGVGMLSTLGARFVDNRGQLLRPGGGHLLDLAAVDWSGIDPRLAAIDIVALCDVDNPLLGATGSARVFAPQKGANAADVAVLDRALRHLVDVLDDHRPAVATAPRALAATAGAGAAGGLAFGLLCLGGRLESGADHLLDLLAFDAALARADVVITGEGRLDEQTLAGKAPARVAARARGAGLPTIAVVGTCTLPARTVDERFDACYALSSMDPRCADDPALTRRLLAQVGRGIAQRYAAEH